MARENYHDIAHASYSTLYLFVEAVQITTTQLLGKIVSKDLGCCHCLERDGEGLTFNYRLNDDIVTRRKRYLSLLQLTLLPLYSYTYLAEEASTADTGHVRCYGHGSSTLPPGCHLVWITTEICNVVLYPLQCQALVLNMEQ